MIRADLHTHTLASHGLATVHQMWEEARKLGLEYIGFSEHSPLPPGFSCALYTGNLERDFPLYIQQVLALDGVGPRPLLGMELDWIPSRLDWMRKLAALAPFDYIYGSLHYVDGYSVGKESNWPDVMPLDAKFERFNAYYAEMASAAASGLFQAITHPDFIKLRAYADFQKWLRLPESLRLVERTLSALKAHNVAMEVNAAGMRWPFNEPYPGPAIMRIAHEIGVKIVLGSDAHAAGQVAQNFARLERYARSFGFRSYQIYIQKKAFLLDF